MRKAYASNGDVIKARTTDVEYGYRRGDTLKVLYQASSAGAVWAENLTRPGFAGRSEALLLKSDYKVIEEKGTFKDVSRVYFLGIPFMKIIKVTKDAE